MAAIKYRHDQPLKRGVSPFWVVFSVLCAMSAVGVLYMCDYANMIDLPIMDDVYDRSRIANPNN